MSKEKIKILAVDDEEENLEALCVAMHQAFPEAEIFTAPGGAVGLGLAAETDPDVILLDLKMPGMDGYETCRRLKADPRVCDIPVILLTAVKPDKETFELSYRAGAESFASKPLELWELAVQIRAMSKIKKANLAKREESSRLRSMVKRRTAELDGELSANVKLLEALKESEALFKAVFDETPFGICLLEGGTGRFLRVNPALARMLGRTGDELRGVCWRDITHPDDVGSQEAQMALMNSGGAGVVRMAKRYLRKDGSLAWVKLTLSPLSASSGKRFIGLVEDIENARNSELEKKQLEEQLRQAQKMDVAGQLAGGIAHDFNNILAAILAYSDFIINGLSESNKERADAEEIKKAALRGAALTKQLLTFSRKQKFQPEVIDLNVLLKDMQGMLLRLLGEDIDFSAVAGDEAALIKADKSYVEQVILNLAVNARDAMPKGGRLVMESSVIYMDTKYIDRNGTLEPGHYVVLSVSDTGVGMSEEVKSHIFEPFFTTKPREKGTGLGLSTVHGIVKQSGGIITVYSEEGRGTVFRIYMLLAEAAKPLRALSQHAKSMIKSEGGVVLVVDDDEQIRALACRSLSGEGFAVMEAANAEEALLLVETKKPALDLLLTDMVLPKMSGFELKNSLKRLFPHLEVVYMSGYTEHNVFNQEKLDLENNFLQKPFTLDLLLRKTIEALARATGRKKNANI